MGKPSVFVLGAQKCGTTTVADMLAAQPEVFVPSVKETYFFCDEELWAKGQDWYSDDTTTPLQPDRIGFSVTLRRSISPLEKRSTDWLTTQTRTRGSSSRCAIRWIAPTPHIGISAGLATNP